MTSGIWVDVGNGYPYVEPYPLGSEAVVSHPFFEYKVIETEGVWQVQHRNNYGQWRTNQTFENRADIFFVRCTNPNSKKIMGVFGLRVNRWSETVFILKMKNWSAWISRIRQMDKPNLGCILDLNLPLRKHGTYFVTENRS